MAVPFSTSPPPPTAAPTPPLPPKKRWTRKRSITMFCVALLVGVVVLVGGGVAYLEFNYRRVASNVPNDARIGECYNTGGSLQPVDCSGHHTFEVIDELVGFRGEYPGRIDRYFALEPCDETFLAVYGHSYFSSSYEIVLRFPSEEDWDAGDRLIACVVFAPEGW